jgi:hypothetical protein
MLHYGSAASHRIGSLLAKEESMSVPKSISDYLRLFGSELGDRVLQSYPALHNLPDPISGTCTDTTTIQRRNAGSGL